MADLKAATTSAGREADGHAAPVATGAATTTTTTATTTGGGGGGGSGSGNDYASRMTRVVSRALHDTAIGGTAPLVSLVGQYAATKLLVSLCVLSARELAQPLPQASAVVAAAAEEEAPTPVAAAAADAKAPAAAAAAASPPAKPGAWRSKRVQQLQEQQQQQQAAAAASAVAAPAGAAADADTTADQKAAPPPQPQPQRCACVIRDAYTLDCVARFVVDDVDTITNTTTAAAAAAAPNNKALKPSAYALDVWPSQCWIVVCGPAVYADADSTLPHWSRTVKLFEYGCWDDDTGWGGVGHGSPSNAAARGLVSVRKVLEFVAPLRPFPARELRSIEQQHELELRGVVAASGTSSSSNSSSTDDDAAASSYDVHREHGLWTAADHARRVGDDGVPMCFALAPDERSGWSGTNQPCAFLHRAAVTDAVPGFAPGYAAYAAAVARGGTNAVAVRKAAAAAAKGKPSVQEEAANGAPLPPRRVTLALALLDHVLLYDVAGLLHVLAAKQHEHEDEGEGEADDAGSGAVNNLGILNPLTSHWERLPGYAGARSLITQLVRYPRALMSDLYATVTVGGATRLFQPPYVGAEVGVAGPMGAASEVDAKNCTGGGAGGDPLGRLVAQAANRALDKQHAYSFATTSQLVRRDLAMADVPSTLVWGGVGGWVVRNTDTPAGPEPGQSLIGARFGQLFAMDLSYRGPAAHNWAPQHPLYSLRSAAVCGVSVVDLDARLLFARFYGNGERGRLPLPVRSQADRRAALAAGKRVEEDEVHHWWFRDHRLPVVLYAYNPHDAANRTNSMRQRERDAARADAATASAAAAAPAAATAAPAASVRGLDADDDELVKAGEAAEQRAAKTAADHQLTATATVTTTMASGSTKAAAAGSGTPPGPAAAADDDEMVASSPLAVWAPGLGSSANGDSQDDRLTNLRVRVVVPAAASTGAAAAAAAGGGARVTGWRNAAQRYYRLVRVDRDGSCLVAQRTGRAGLCALRWQEPLATTLVPPTLTYEVRAVTDTLKAQDYAFVVAE